MRIEIDIDEKYSNTEVIIKSPRLTEDIEKMISLMRLIDMQIAVKKNDETFLLDAADILYIEAVERNTFIYTEECTYESQFKLYELERHLEEKDFIRISKQSIINLKKSRA